mmetsp:Transcript_7643/g.27992  ORF Transcript_7643/g.27992 Transcript_7643/m.27992 type:complete len:347 (-) Transcript_7643:161-1201(-)
MFALCRRRNRGATLTSDRADVPETFSGPAVASARQMVRERFRVAVTLLSGDRLEPLEFAADAPVRDLKAAVKERWGMPVAAQRLVFGTQVIDAEEAEHIGIALLTAVAAEEGEHQELLQNEDAVIELNCVRTTIPEEEQKRLDRALLVASGEGDLACMRLLLSEGASAEGHPPAPTPLLLALAARDEPAAALLRGAGAPVLAAAELRPTASGLANAFVRSDLTEVVHQLASGADPNLRLQRGEGRRRRRSALQVAGRPRREGRRGRLTAVARTVLRRGGDLRGVGAAGREAGGPLLQLLARRRAPFPGLEVTRNPSSLAPKLGLLSKIGWCTGFSNDVRQCVALGK